MLATSHKSVLTLRLKPDLIAYQVVFSLLKAVFQGGWMRCAVWVTGLALIWANLNALTLLLIMIIPEKTSKCWAELKHSGRRSNICFVNVLLGVEAQQRCCLWNLVFLVQVKVEKHSFGSTVCQAREMYNILLFAYQGPPGAPGKDGLKVKSRSDLSVYFFAVVIISFITPLPFVIVELLSPKIVIGDPLLLSETRYLRWCTSAPNVWPVCQLCSSQKRSVNR